MNNLIEKIEALKVFFIEYEEGYSSEPLIEKHDVLEIIKAEFEEKELPNCEGWWWNGKEFVDVIFIDTPEGGFYAYWDVNQNVICETGKWVKAMVPIG